MNDSYAQTHQSEQRIAVTVLYLEGEGVGARARVRTEAGEKLWAPAALVAEGLGVPVDEHLPLRRALALVKDGQLVAFAPVGR